MMRIVSYLSIAAFLPLISLQFSHSQNDSFYYDACKPYTCGNITVAFPFFTSSSFCGLPGYEVACDNSTSTPTLILSKIRYRIIDIHRTDCVITVSDSELTQGLQINSCDTLRRHFLPAASFSPLQLPYWNIVLNFSLCAVVETLPSTFMQQAVNYTVCGGNDILYAFSPIGSYNNNSKLPSSCAHLALPVQEASLLSDEDNITSRENLLSILADGFALQWTNATSCWDCEAAGGRCGYNETTDKVVCFCKYGCSGGAPGTGRSNSRKVIAAIVVPTTLILLAAGMIALIKFRTRASSISNLDSRSISRSDKVDVAEFIKNYRSMLPSEFSYDDVKKITDGFRVKLGGGGYGNVYKGILPSGRLIAAKILEKSKDDGRDFVSEVATIGRIHHVNIIRLQGFCCDGSRRALIYEFMPRGSLGDLIFKENIRQSLGMSKLLEIAIGIARGLEYLHQGCEKRILHLDIKPHNVLLDYNFLPKISDFGMAKFFSRKDSVVTLTGARGTVGYIAPEIIMRNLGGVSHKSDVYSYGMFILEMVMGRKNVKLENELSSCDSFPNWIYDQLDQWKQMEMEELVVEEDITISRKLVMVALWCIQTNPIDRPSVSTALGMLTGRTESIEMPPKPCLFSPPRRQLEQIASHIDNRDSMTDAAESE